MDFEKQFEAAKSLRSKGGEVPALINIDVGNSFIFEGETYLVKDKFKYTEYRKKKAKKTGEPWYELEIFNVDTGEVKYMEVEDDDEVIVYFTDEIKIKVSELSLKPSQVEDFIDDEEDIDGYEYDDDYYAIFEREGKEEETVWIAEYENGNNWMCIEGWERDEDDYQFEVSKGRIVKEDEFEVIS